MSAPYQLLPALSDDELHQLAESIGQHGVLVPVVIDEEGAVIDGHHRQMIADSMGIDYPVEMRADLADTEKRTLALELNLHRRQLTTEVKRALVTRSLKADPELSNRQHASRCGCDHKTVATVRASMVRRGEIDELAERQAADGRTFPASKPNPTASNGEIPQCSSPPPNPQASDMDAQDRPADAPGVTAPCEPVGDSRTGGPHPSGPAPTDEPPLSPAMQRLKYAGTATRALSVVRDRLLVLDPDEIVAAVPPDERAMWSSLADDLRTYADRIDQALAPTLRSVQ